MRLDTTEAFDDDLANAPQAVQKAMLKQANLLATDLRYPSLRAKKYDQTKNIWQARVNRTWRFYFTIKNNTYILIALLPHPK